MSSTVKGKDLAMSVMLNSYLTGSAGVSQCSLMWWAPLSKEQWVTPGFSSMATVKATIYGFEEKNSQCWMLYACVWVSMFLCLCVCGCECPMVHACGSQRRMSVVFYCSSTLYSKMEFLAEFILVISPWLTGYESSRTYMSSPTKPMPGLEEQEAMPGSLFEYWGFKLRTFYQLSHSLGLLNVL